MIWIVLQFNRDRTDFSKWYATSIRTSPVVQAVKNLPMMQEPQETQVRSLGWEYPLEEGMAPHSSILAWRIPWTEEPGEIQPIGSQRVGHDWHNWACTHKWVPIWKQNQSPTSYHPRSIRHISVKSKTIKFFYSIIYEKELPWWLRWWSVCLQYRRPRFDPWIGKISWRRKWQPTPVFLPGESQGRRSLVGYSPWGRKESDTTERLHFTSYMRKPMALR